MASSIHSTFIGFIAATLILAGMPLAPAQAGMIGTAQQLQMDERAVHAGKVQQFMARDDVRTQLLELGVSPESAAERVDALTDAELQELAQRIDEAPAGGGLFGLLGVIFVVLIVLEVVGVTNIFNFR